MKHITLCAENNDGVNIIFENMKTALENMLKDLPINNKELLILKSIMTGGDITSAEISGMFSVSKAAVSQFVSSLEKRGYLRRRLSDKDRRRVYFDITDAGVELVRSTDEYIAESINIVKNRLGENDYNTMIELLKKTTTILADISENKRLSRQEQRGA